MNDGRQPEWGYQDCVIQALSQHLNCRSFTWITIPPCEVCHALRLTIREDMWLPRLKWRSQAESYRCANATCSAQIWLPRGVDYPPPGYSQSKSYCLSILCRAVGSRVHWVWNAEDDEWIEVDRGV